MSHKTEETLIFPNSSAPFVINHDLLVNLVIDQGPKEEAGKLFAEDDINLSEVTEIRIEHLNILNISHLWIMSNLVILKLSSNIIEKIENLENLVKLKELDLSFNRIKIMENLNHLVDLEILLLYHNKIEVVEGIDNLEKIQIVSLGRNEIKCRNHVMYLRRFNNLRTLNMEGNPCTEDEEYLDYLIAYIPQIVYLQYKMITEEQRRKAIDKHFREICNLQEKEDEEKEAIIAKKNYEDHFIEISACYVEYLEDDHLFNQMFNSDKEGKALMKVNRETESAHEQYKIAFLSFCHELFDYGIKEQKRRMDELELFQKTVDNGKNDAQLEAHQLIEEILENKSKTFFQVTNLIKSLSGENSEELKKNISKVKVISEEFDDLLHKTWKRLMNREIILHEQLEDLNEIFKINMTDMVGSCLETAQGFFTMMRNTEREYDDNLKSLVTLFMNSFGDNTLPLEYQEICGSKDIMMNNFGASHDMHLHVIDDREDIFVNRLKSWLDELTDKQIEEEKKRHRNQILEISHFFDFQREEFHKLQQRQEFILTKLNKDVGEVDEENEETIQDSGKDLSREEINEDEVQEYDSSVDIKKYYDNEKYNYEKEDVGEFDNENNAYIYPDSISNE